ncbi:MAG: hypothetical protein HY078_09380 [Elusimicrobia bacterium]|nr:hypothetical protein [Elusimicrobiota bacterium]
MNLAPCPDCNAQVSAAEGPVHPYLGASSGCWALYGEVLAREYSDPRYGKVHRLTVDAYSAQHPGKSGRRAAQSVDVHLLALYLVLEAGFSHEDARAVLSTLIAEHKRHDKPFDWLEPPKHLGRVTVLDIHAAKNAETHCRRVAAWADDVWSAWKIHHAYIRSLAQKFVDRRRTRTRTATTPSSDASGRTPRDA